MGVTLGGLSFGVRGVGAGPLESMPGEASMDASRHLLMGFTTASTATTFGRTQRPNKSSKRPWSLKSGVLSDVLLGRIS